MQRNEERRSEICTNHSTFLEDGERGKSLIEHCLKAGYLGAVVGIRNRKLIDSCCHAHGELVVTAYKLSFPQDPLQTDQSTTSTAIFRGWVAGTLIDSQQ